ncbi:MAG TPA: GNAT family N-acetyltransferase [Thermoanaerobaculia bacterium]|nr:GNAT family N-acetyltransferase [Thermoanaerobaculia bacterium]
MTIREATTSDAAILAALSTQLGYPAQPEEAAERLSALGPDSAVLVAEENGAVLGWIHVCGMRFFQSPPFAEVGGLVVDEASRGKGVGKLLLDAGARWAAERGYRKLRVRSNVIREDTHRFYERESFRRVKTQVVLDRELGQEVRLPRRDPGSGLPSC